jgi:pre-rRNA-processing protein TSR1
LKAMVRYMFHNPDDVKWFKASFCFLVDVSYLFTFYVNKTNILQPVELWTKHGRRGRIKETVGTHGMLTKPFDKKDSVIS